MRLGQLLTPNVGSQNENPGLACQALRPGFKRDPSREAERKWNRIKCLGHAPNLQTSKPPQTGPNLPPGPEHSTPSSETPGCLVGSRCEVEHRRPRVRHIFSNWAVRKHAWRRVPNSTEVACSTFWLGLPPFFWLS